MAQRSSWHPSSRYPLQLWERNLCSPLSPGRPISLLAWRDAAAGTWEWEVVQSLADTHLTGASAQTLEAAIAAAEAALLGLEASRVRRMTCAEATPCCSPGRLRSLGCTDRSERKTFSYHLAGSRS